MNSKTVLIVLVASLFSAISAVLLYAMVIEKKELEKETYLPVKLASYNEAIFSGKLQRKFLSSAPTNFIAAAEVSTPAVVNIKAIQGSGQNIWGKGSGSGVVVSPDGFVVTNYHVIENSDYISISLEDKRELDAEVVGFDRSSDIALLKVDANNLPHLLFGNSDSLRVGEWVLAVGNPFNLQSTVTTGIISAKSRNINILAADNPIESFIQTDAVINPGNSGGALVNTNGELIGINTAIITESGRYEGYSFAVPSNLVSKVITDLIDYGEVKRGFLGINIEEVTPSLANKLGMARPKGVVISRVLEGSGAELAGIQPNDVILKINNTPIKSIPALQELVARFHPGNKLIIDLFRNHEVIQVSVALKGIPQKNREISELIAPFFKKFGFEARDLSISEKRIAGTEGVKVISITKRKPIAKSNMEINYIITSVNNTAISSLSDLYDVLSMTKQPKIIMEGIYEDFQGTYQYSFPSK